MKAGNHLSPEFNASQGKTVRLPILQRQICVQSPEGINMHSDNPEHWLFMDLMLQNIMLGTMHLHHSPAFFKQRISSASLLHIKDRNSCGTRRDRNCLHKEVHLDFMKILGTRFWFPAWSHKLNIPFSNRCQQSYSIC